MVSTNQALDAARLRSPDLKIFVKDVRDPQARKRAITVRSWSTVKDIKDVIMQILHVPPSAQRLYFGPLMTSGGELPNHRTLHDAGIYRSGETLLLDINAPVIGEADFSSVSSLRPCADVCVSSSVIDACPRLLQRTAQQARRGLALGLKPELVLEGSGGTYFLRDARKNKVAVFKPGDEEPYAENNPRGYVKHVDAKVDIYNNELFLRAGILPGEACLREVAAYLLDHSGFSGVPMTTLAEARHPAFNTNGARLKLSEGGASFGPHSLNPQASASSSLAKKVGSFQEFVDCECTMDDLGRSVIPKDEIHKIAILDIRIMNADRNAANLLCRRKPDNSIELVPIDHGYCLRDVCDVAWWDWAWLDWPQMKEPLSEKSKRYILSLDIDADVKMLKERFNIDGKAADYFRASTSLLQAGVKAGLTLYDIAVMCCRNDNAGEIPSKLEVLASMASELAKSAVENGRWHHVAASNALAEQLSPEGGSLLDSPRAQKSISSIDLKTLGIESSRDVPAMAQSTGSDTSSVEEDEPTVECEEWAANLIADVSLDKSMSISYVKPRTASVCSEYSGDSELSSSPKGFWFVKPGTSPDEDESDADSFSWSPHTSAKKMEFAVVDTRSVADKDKGDETLITPTNAIVDSCHFLLPPPATVNVSTFKKAEAASSLLRATLTKSPRGLARSQSYSAFSDLRRGSTGNSTGDSRRLPPIEQSELYCGYFSKFVDLVVARETTALSVDG